MHEEPRIGSSGDAVTSNTESEPFAPLSARARSPRAAGGGRSDIGLDEVDENVDADEDEDEKDEDDEEDDDDEEDEEDDADEAEDDDEEDAEVVEPLNGEVPLEEDDDDDEEDEDSV